MGRELPTGLQELLDLSSCNTQTTVSFIPVSGSPLHFATDDFTTGGNDYTSDLQKTDEIRQSIFAATDRVSVIIQNIDKAIGGVIAAETLAKAEAIIGRYHRNEQTMAAGVWVELFRGMAVPLEVSEAEARIEVINDLAAAGYCIGAWTLAENCQFVYKHPTTCGSTTPRIECNKKRKSLHGCEGDANEHRFGGMEFPDVQAAEPPSGGDDGGGATHPPYCPQRDQWTLVRGRSGMPVAKRVEDLLLKDLIFNPIWRTFHAIKRLRIIAFQPIWKVSATNGARGYSSFTHPLLATAEDRTGLAAAKLAAGDPILTTFSEHLQERRIAESMDTGRLGEVIFIEMEDGHIYCYGDRPNGPWIVCHNSKPPKDELEFY